MTRHLSKKLLTHPWQTFFWLPFWVMKNLLRYLIVALMIGGAFAQVNNNGQQIWILSVVELVMYPGSSVQYNETEIGAFNSQTLCDAARKYIPTKFNSSTKCSLKKKTKAKN